MGGGFTLRSYGVRVGAFALDDDAPVVVDVLLLLLLLLSSLIIEFVNAYDVNEKNIGFFG